MAENSKIEWCDHTYNPWFGCTKVSPGCDHCYAETLMDKRWHRVNWGQGNPRVQTSASTYNQVWKWERKAEREGKRVRVFCASLADVFDAEVPDEWRDDLFELIRNTYHIDWLLLTKRPHLASHWFQDHALFKPNVWLGTSIENKQVARARIENIAQAARYAGGAKVFLSMEPLLERVSIQDFLQREWIDWVIVGGESGPGYRPMDLDWARSIRDDCRDFNVPFFFKQTAGKGVIPDDLMIREFPKTT